MAKSKKKKIPAMPLKKLSIGGLLYLFMFAGAKEQFTGTDNDEICGGTELWQQKILTDSDTSQITNDKSPKLFTIVDLNKIVTDSEKRSASHPRLQFEKEVVKVRNVLIREVIREKDNDYHLVIQDRKGNHMIAEIPDPQCDRAADNARFIDGFLQARNMMDKHAHDFQHWEFDITGVPFRDRPHEQTGKADNDLEIHPVIKLRAVKKLNF